MGSIDSDFAYDDAFKTMVVESDELVLPLLNEMFGEHYRGDERIIRYGNEHYIEQGGGSEEKRITDSLLGVAGEQGEVKKYHVECESGTDGSMLARFFEYDTQIALDDSEYGNYRLTLEFPHSGVLFLRGGKMPDEMTVEFRTPGGNVSYPVRVMRMTDYTVDDFFEKRLYFLIPFYIFNLEKRLAEIDGDAGKLEELKDVYRGIAARMEETVEQGGLEEFSETVIKEMSNRVANKLAGKYGNVRKGIGDLMGGKVLETEAVRIKREGKMEGRKEGKREGKKEIIEIMLRKGQSPEQVADLTELPIDFVRSVEQSILQMA